jgi:hypothetical protein
MPKAALNTWSFWLLAAFGAQLQVSADMLPRHKPCQKPKILTPHRYIISVNALDGLRFYFYG